MIRGMRRARVVAALLVGLAAAVHAVALSPSSAPSLDAANEAWSRGDYVAALNGFIGVLTAPGGNRALESIALTTGELFQTRGLTAGGRAGRFSPDGKF